MLPRFLSDNRNEILAIHGMISSNDFQPIRYYASRWIASFPDDADVIQLIGRFPDTMSRTNLQTLSREACTDKSKFRQLFLATMMWGYGDLGYGPSRTLKALDDPDFDKKLESVFQRVWAGEEDQQLGNFPIKNCKMSFGSKILYAIGLGTARKPMLLVLDDNVQKSLRQLYEDSDASESGAAAWKTSGYDWYLRIMDRWAGELNCRADALEMFLFKHGQTVDKDWRRD
jgi:hypothetical protein